MSFSSPNGSFYRGMIPLLVLSLLKHKDMYGYQLVQEISKCSDGRVTIHEGSLYPVLYKFLEQGIISDRKIQVGRRMTRVYYHLEPAGEVLLQKMLQEIRDVALLLNRINSDLDE